MSASLIGFGCDLQQKLDAMDRKLRRTRWAGDVGVALYRIARKLDRLAESARQYGWTPDHDRRERQLIQRANEQASKLGSGVTIHRPTEPNAWPLVVVFPGDIRPGDRPEEKGVAVPPRP
ncbi:MAG: hypothetical protein AABZ47_00515 [Planctomycetota bacterium]